MHDRKVQFFDFSREFPTHMIDPIRFQSDLISIVIDQQTKGPFLAQNDLIDLKWVFYRFNNEILLQFAKKGFFLSEITAIGAGH